MPASTVCGIAGVGEFGESHLLHSQAIQRLVAECGLLTYVLIFYVHTSITLSKLYIL